MKKTRMISALLVLLTLCVLCLSVWADNNGGAMIQGGPAAGNDEQSATVQSTPPAVSEIYTPAEEQTTAAEDGAEPQAVKTETAANEETVDSATPITAEGDNTVTTETNAPGEDASGEPSPTPEPIATPEPVATPEPSVTVEEAQPVDILTATTVPVTVISSESQSWGFAVVQRNESGQWEAGNVQLFGGAWVLIVLLIVCALLLIALFILAAYVFVRIAQK